MGLMHINIAPTEPIRDPRAELAYWAREIVACQLIEDAAGHLGVASHDVWACLCSVPENLLSLLDTPQGWTMLAGFAAAELGVDAPDFMPAVH